MNYVVNNTTNTSNTTIRYELMANMDSLYNYYASIRAPAIIIHELRNGINVNNTKTIANTAKETAGVFSQQTKRSL